MRVFVCVCVYVYMCVSVCVCVCVHVCAHMFLLCIFIVLSQNIPQRVAAIIVLPCILRDAALLVITTH